MKLITICFALFFHTVICTDFKLSDSKLLLPYQSFITINYTISGSKGACYKWHSSTPEVATVTPITNGNVECSDKAIVSAVWQSSHRATTTVYAQHAVTGHVTKCDVIVDTIHKLEIETTTQELYLHDAPEALVARAVDEFGNTFTSLEGLPFEWKIHTITSDKKRSSESPPFAEGHTVLRFITWTESEYETPPHIADLESQGMQGSMQLVSGLKTGSARVSLSVKENIYRQVGSGEVKLLVMANAMLNPALVYVLPYAQVKYRVTVVSQGSIHEVQMPSQQYYLKVNNTDLATLDSPSSIVTAKKYGETEIILLDRNIDENFRKPTSLMHVVEPGYLAFSVFPGRKWVLEVGVIYQVTIDVLDHNSHRVHPSDNLRLKAVFPADRFTVLQSSPNGTHHVVKPLKKGVTLIDATLKDIELPDGTLVGLDNEVRGSQEVEVYDPIEVIPAQVVLPWDPRHTPSVASITAPSSQPAQLAYPLRAIGGSGEYSWYVGDTQPGLSSSIIAVSVKGEVIPKGPGDSVVVAADVRNLHNLGRAQVSVVPPASISFLPSAVEVEIGVGRVLDLPLAMFDHQGRPMSDCRHLPIQIQVADESVIIHGEPVGNIWRRRNSTSAECMLVRIRGVKPGFTEVVATYAMAGLSDGVWAETGLLTAKVTVGAYLPARFEDPETNTLVAVGSTRTFRVTGGPRPWILDPSGYFYHLEEQSGQPPASNWQALSANQGIRFDLQCREVGESHLSILIGNKPTAKNQFAAVSHARVTFICAVPVRLRLVPVLHLPQGVPPCPIANDTDNQQVPVQNRRPVRVDLIFMDNEGRHFDKTESLSVSVSLLSPSTHKLLTDTVSVNQPTVLWQSDCTTVCQPWFLITPKTPGETMGPVLAEVVSNSYNRDVLGTSGTISTPKFSLQGKLDLLLTKEPVVEPTSLIAFDHFKVQLPFHISLGSGYFHVTPDSALSIVAQSPPSQPSTKSPAGRQQSLMSRNFLVTPLRQTKTRLEVHDLCLALDRPLNVDVKVVALTSIDLLIVDKIQIGNQATGLIIALDSDGEPISADYLSQMRLTVITERGNPLVKVISSPQVSAWPERWETGAMQVTVKGIALGTTRLIVRGERRDSTPIMSPPRDIQVFPPLRLSPRHVTLLIGAEMQLMTTGGPQPATIEYLLDTNSTGGVRSQVDLSGLTGLVRGVKVGSPVKVWARAVGPHPLTGESKAIYSEDEGQVLVVVLEGIRIVSPLTDFVVGGVVPIWASGVTDDVTPMSMAGMKPALDFYWTLSPPEPAVARLEHILHPYKVFANKSHLSCGLRLRGLSPGKITVQLRVRARNPGAGQLKAGSELISKRVFRVIELFGLINPVKDATKILMTPNSQLQIQTNRDSNSKIRYKLVSSSNDAPGFTLSSSGLLRAPVNSDPLSSTAPVVLVVQSQNMPDPSTNHRSANQTLALLVEVKSVAYMMVSAIDPGLNPASSAGHLTALPTGGPYPFRVNFYDDLGVPFDVVADSSNIGLRQSRTDRVDLSLDHVQDKTAPSTTTKSPHLADHTQGGDHDEIEEEEEGQSDEWGSSGQTGRLRLRVYGVEPVGETLVQLKHLGHQRLTDIVSLPSDEPLLPTPTLPVVNADLLYFKSLYAGGTWTSNAPSLLSIDPVTGIGRCRGVGAVQVSYNLPLPSVESMQDPTSALVLTEQVTVEPADRVVLSLSPSTESVNGNQVDKPIFISAEQSKSILVYLHTNSKRTIDAKCSEGTPRSLHKTLSEEHFDWSIDQSDNSPFSCGVKLHLPRHFDEGDIDFWDWSRLVSVRLGIDNKVGVYVCQVTSNRATEEDLLRLAKYTPEGAKIEITGHIKSSHQQSSVTSAPVSLPLAPGFRLLASPQALTRTGQVTSLRVALSPATRALCQQMVAGQACLEVRSQRPDLVQVLPHREDQDNPGVVEVPLQAMHVDKSIDETISVSLRLAIVDQVESAQIRVQLDPVSANMFAHNTNDKEGFGWHFKWWPIVLAILLAIFVIILVNLILRTPSTPIIDPSHMRPIYPHMQGAAGDYMPSSSPYRSSMGQSSPRTFVNSATPANRLWSHGYSFAEPGCDFQPITSPYRRSPVSPVQSLRSPNTSL